VFSEVSSLFGSPLDIRRSEENTRETEPENDRIPRGSDSVFPVVLFASPDVPSKLLTSLNILITGRNEPEKFGLGVCLA
jgi:hypothetical protein